MMMPALNDNTLKEYLLRPEARSSFAAQNGACLRTVNGASGLRSYLTDRSFLCMHYRLDGGEGASKLDTCHLDEQATAGPAAAAAAAHSPGSAAAGSAGPPELAKAGMGYSPSAAAVSSAALPHAAVTAAGAAQSSEHAAAKSGEAATAFMAGMPDQAAICSTELPEAAAAGSAGVPEGPAARPALFPKEAAAQLRQLPEEAAVDSGETAAASVTEASEDGLAGAADVAAKHLLNDAASGAAQVLQAAAVQAAEHAGSAHAHAHADQNGRPEGGSINEPILQPDRAAAIARSGQAQTAAATGDDCRMHGSTNLDSTNPADPRPGSPSRKRQATPCICIKMLCSRTLS